MSVPFRVAFGSHVTILIVALTGCGETAAVGSIDEVPLLTAVPELRIGSPDDPEYAFPSIGALTIGSDGTIYSLHRQEAAVRRWTSDGQPLTPIGRDGDGPGEFRQPQSLGSLDGELWVLDGEGYRVSFFSPDGSYRDRLSPLVNTGLAADGTSPPRPAGMFADGTMYGLTPAWSDEVARGALTALAQARLTPEGTTIDTLHMLPVGRATTLAILSSDGIGGTFTQQPFGDAVMSLPTTAGDGLLVLDRTARPGSAEFRVTRLDLSGDTVFSRSIPYTPVPVQDDTVGSAVSSIATRLHEGFGARTGVSLSQYQTRIREAMYVPPHYTPVSAMVSGRDGTVWLGLNPAQSGTREWLVLSEQGELIARLQLPEGVRVAAADREFVWGIERDDLGVEYIVRYAVSDL